VQKAFSSIAIAAAFAAALAVPGAAQARSFEEEVLAEVNYAREHPAVYALILEMERATDPRVAGNDPTDPDAFAEAIAFLEQQQPLKPLRADDRLSEVAGDHVTFQGLTGEVGHGAFVRRLRDKQIDNVWAAEDIDYGQHTPSQVVRRFIVDAGVRDRGHRTAIFGEAYETSGVSCGPHVVYGAMCVVDFASQPVTRASRTGSVSAD
jgi:uncharacterized protein YkwD